MNKKSAKKLIRTTTIIAIVAVALAWVCSHFVHLGAVEWTDNAQVRRNLVPINSRVQGYVKRICFDDFEEVKAGDTLVIIDNSEYLLRVAQTNAAYRRALVDSTAMGTTISTTDNNLSVSDAPHHGGRVGTGVARHPPHHAPRLLPRPLPAVQGHRLPWRHAMERVPAQRALHWAVRFALRLVAGQGDTHSHGVRHRVARLAVYHAATAERPFIHLATFAQPKFFIISLLFVSYSVLSGTAGQIQNMFTEGILGFDMFHSISLNWSVVAGILCGTPFTFYALAMKKWHPRNVVIVGFSFFTMYQVALYFLIGPETGYHQLWLPMWLRGVGTAVLYVVLAYTLGKNVPFVYYFQALCAIGFIRTGVGTPVCQSVLSHLLNIFRKESLMQLSAEMTLANPVTKNFSALYAELQRQSMMVGLKEVFGIAAAVGIVTIICLCFSDLRGKFKGVIPKLPSLWRMVKYDKRH